MSFDELPPDGGAARDDSSSPADTGTGADSPPSRSRSRSRRRPARAAAAPAPAESAAAPARPRSRRSRRSPADSAPAPADLGFDVTPLVTAPPAAAAPDVPPPPELPPDAEAIGAAVRRARRSRRPEPADAETPDAGDADKTKRTRRGGRRRGRSADAEGDEAEATETEKAPAERVVRRAPVRKKPRPAPPPPEPKPVVDVTVGAHVVYRNGRQHLLIDNKPVAPLIFFGNSLGAEPGSEEAAAARITAEIGHAAAAGVHVHSLLVMLPTPLAAGDDALAFVDSILRLALDADPSGYVLPRIVFDPDTDWCRRHAGDIVVGAEPHSSRVSIGSDRYWSEAADAVSRLAAYIRGKEWACRVVGYHLDDGEWFQPAQQGFDRSVAARDSFREWLSEKYEDDLTALRASWYDGDVTFASADVPTPPDSPVANRAFFEHRRERSTIDYCEFASEKTATRILALARAVKKATDYQALVSVCYGYTLEFGHPGSGHLALGMLNASYDVDLVCGPPSYRDRELSGAASLPGPVDSLALHDKIWISEDDTKTFLAQPGDDDDFNPRMPDAPSTEQARLRACGRALACGTGIAWMDLLGEGWLDDPDIWQRNEGFSRVYGLAAEEPAGAPDLAVLVDERSLLHVQKGEEFFRNITAGLRNVLQRAGISYGFYLQSDVLADAFPTTCRAYLFATPFRLPEAHRRAIQTRLQSGDRTLVWLYAPGCCERRPSAVSGLEEGATDSTGLTLRQQPWNSMTGSVAVSRAHPLAAGLSGPDIGTPERLNPTFYAADEDAVTVAEYADTGLPSVAARRCGSWTSVFIGEPGITLELLHGICRTAGIHVYSDAGTDVVDVGAGWLSLHAGADGRREIRLPSATSVYDVGAGRVLAESAVSVAVNVRQGETTILALGTPGRFARLGLPGMEGVAPDAVPEAPPRGQAVSAIAPLEAPPKAASRTRRGSRRRAEPAAEEPLPPSADGDSAKPAPTPEHLQILRDVLAVDISAIGDVPDMESDVLADAEALPERNFMATAEPGEAPPPARRHRRRGGRGRGRRQPGAGEATGDGNQGDAAPPE